MKSVFRSQVMNVISSIFSKMLSSMMVLHSVLKKKARVEYDKYGIRARNNNRN